MGSRAQAAPRHQAGGGQVMGSRAQAAPRHRAGGGQARGPLPQAAPCHCAEGEEVRGPRAQAPSRTRTVNIRGNTRHVQLHAIKSIHKFSILQIFSKANIFYIFLIS
jgi:hypothetical protein